VFSLVESLGVHFHAVRYSRYVLYMAPHGTILLLLVLRFRFFFPCKFGIDVNCFFWGGEGEGEEIVSRGRELFIKS
jgi:hypothetical protein